MERRWMKRLRADIVRGVARLLSVPIAVRVDECYWACVRYRAPATAAGAEAKL